MTTKHGTPLLSWLLLVVSVGTVASASLACDVATEAREASVAEIKAFFAARNKQVLTFFGYSGAGYQDPGAMLERAASVLDGFDPENTIVNIGATAEGIGAVYEAAKRRGFMTTGIVSTQAKKYKAALSPCVDYVFYVEDATWGGFVEGSERLSPTSTAMVETSDVMVGIGGGAVGRDELTAGKRLGKEVRFYPADMNHETAREKARKKGLPEPTDFGGAASGAFAR